jgi:hypothetical protein
MSDLAIHRPANAISLPDNALWKNRFEIHSESSDRVYIISQNKESGKYGCSCPGYCIHRKCKHLIDGCGLTTSEIHGYGQLAAPASRKKLR